MLFRVFLLFIGSCLAFPVIAQRPVKKKNSRPMADTAAKEVNLEAGQPVYFFEFTKPDFLISKVRIEHDENGIGKITFEKKKLEEEFILPLNLSHVTNSLLKSHWANLDFLASSDNYQSKREYPHLGTMKLEMALDGECRTAEFNWTENVDAKALADEYKKIGYQYVWMFDIDVARKNQPLETPKIMKELDTYLRLDVISDPPNMLPYLKELGDDERMPLIARNHAKRLAEKIKKKSEQDR